MIRIGEGPSSTLKTIWHWRADEALGYPRDEGVVCIEDENGVLGKPVADCLGQSVGRGRQLPGVDSCNS